MPKPQDEMINNPTEMPDDLFKQTLDADPEYREMLEAQSKGNDKKDSGAEGDPADDDDLASQGVEDDDSRADDDDDSDSDADDTDDKNSGSQGDDDDEEGFVDNVIDGLSGEEFGKLSEDSQIALANYHKTHSEAVERADALQKQLDGYADDPIIKNRMELISQGKGDLSYEIPSFTDDEKRAIVDAWDNGKDFADVEKKIAEIAEAKARVLLYNQSLKVTQEQKANETNKKGKEILLGLAKFNKNLAVKEADFDKFFTSENGKFAVNEKHPEAESFKNGIGKIRDWCIQKKMAYRDVVDFVDKFGEEAFYAAVAKDLKLPVAINTGERDQKIAADAKRAALKPFLKGAKPKSLSTDGSANRRDMQKTVTDGGYDLERLASDPDYYEKAINKKPGDMAWLEKIGSYRDRGDRILRGKVKRKK